MFGFPISCSFYFTFLFEKFFFDLVRAGFNQRRKTLWNNLQSRYGKTEEVKAVLTAGLEEAGIEPSKRAEALSIEQFADLANALVKYLDVK